MSDGQFPPLTDHSDDLPRTLRRERDNRERAAREQKAREQAPERTAWDRGQLPATQASPYGTPEPANPYDTTYPIEKADAAKVTVTRFKVPFFSLVGFCIKVVLAAIPALIILGAILYGVGVVLQTYFPQLIKLKILISFPGA